MVVTRRVPVPPAPPTSRTTSTQNTPVSSRNKRPGDPSANKLPLESRKASPLVPNKVSNTDTSKNRHSGSILSSFSCLLLLFSLYAAAILHPSPLESFRNALSIPSDNIVKSYIVPPLQAVLSHPTVEPHVTTIQITLQPYAQRVESIVRPVLGGVSKIEGNHVRPLVRRGTIASYVFIRKTWQRFVVPSYNSYLRPYVQPYIDRWDFFYSRDVEPRLRTFVAECMLYYYKIQPYVNNARRAACRYSVTTYSLVAPRVHRFYKTAWPHAVAFYIKGRPHMIAGCRYFKVQAVKGLSVLRTYTAVLAARLGEARHEFVDPHIKRIWEKVESRAVIDTKGTPFSSMSSARQAATIRDTCIENIVTTTPASSASESLAVASPSGLTEPTLKPTLESHIGTVKSVTHDKTLESLTSIVSQPIVIGVAAELVRSKETDRDVSMDVPVTTTTVSLRADVSVSEAPEVPSTTSLETAIPTKAPVVSDGEDGSIDDFLLQLGIFSSGESDTQESVSENQHESPTEHTFSAKQEDDGTEALTVKIAAKRAAIVSRHDDWQAQLDRLSGTRERDLRKSLVGIRKKAVEELNSLLLNGGHDKGEKVVESIEQEAGRLVKGIEGYLKKERDRKEKSRNEWYEQLDDKEKQWEKVLDKVNEKFAEKVRGVQEEVHKWYLGIRGKEADEVLKAAAELRSLAERAQADVGIDYAWLEDVTYDDWQKYHDLMRSAEHFDDTARTIQNGTHAHPPVDPLVPALNALDKEVQEVISGFEVRFSMLRSEGKDLHTKLEPETPSNAPLPTSSDEPTVSILPISDAQNPLMMDPSSIIQGKSQEQIKQAVEMAGFKVNDKNEGRADNQVES